MRQKIAIVLMIGAVVSAKMYDSGIPAQRTSGIAVGILILCIALWLVFSRQS